MKTAVRTAMKCNALFWACPVLVLSSVACGGSSPPPEEPTPTLSEVAPPPEPEPTAEKAPEPAQEEAAKPQQRDRRPLAIVSDPSGPITVGFDGAIIRQGDAEIRIPNGALVSPRNIVFTVDKRHKGDRGKIGEVYTLQIEIPDTQVQIPTARVSRPIESNTEPFLLKLPIPAGAEVANLAVESTGVDEKGRAKSTWVVVRQTKLETSDSGNKAVFELIQLPDAHVHLTTATP